MDKVGCRVKCLLLRRTGSKTKDEEADGGVVKEQWLRGTVEAFRPKTGKHLVVFDVVYGRCVRGGLFGRSDSTSSKVTDTALFNQTFEDRKCILVSPCQMTDQGLVCLPWARGIYFDKCSCHQQCPQSAFRNYNADGAEDPNDPLTKCLNWGVWIDLRLSIVTGSTVLLQPQELVCVCRKIAVHEKHASYAGETFVTCRVCRNQFHSDCIKSAFEIKQTPNESDSEHPRRNGANHDELEKEEKAEIEPKRETQMEIEPDPTQQDRVKNELQVQAETWECPFCVAHTLCDSVQSSASIRKRSMSSSSSSSSFSAPASMSRLRCLNRRGMWLFWRVTDPSLGPVGEWVFTLGQLRHLTGADHEVFVQLELDAIANEADKHRGDVLHVGALESHRQTVLRNAIVGETPLPFCCASTTFQRLLSKWSTTQEEKHAQDFTEAKEGKKKKEQEGSLETFMRQLATQDLEQSNTVVKPWLAVQPTGQVDIYSPRGGYLETRDSLSQSEYSACARVTSADSSEAPGCISPSGKRHIIKWPGSKRTTEHTCARLRPRHQIVHQTSVPKPQSTPRSATDWLETLPLYADTVRRSLIGRKRSRSRQQQQQVLHHQRQAQASGAASAQRRLLRDVAESYDAVEMKAKQLTLGREKRLRFGKSGIHAWGVFAEEQLAPNEFVIEYKGELIRPVVSDLREQLYEAQGIPDYMFRIDDDTVCDATQKGSLARFINHSCDPNCYTSIISHNGTNKIVIYSKRAICPGEELSYDYKFPIETDPEKRIPCYCGAPTCRRFMN